MNPNRCTVVSTNPTSNQFTDVAGLRCSGIFPKGREPSIRSLRIWTKQRRIPYHKVGHFVYFDPAEVEAHIRSKLRVSADELDPAVVVRQRRPVSAEKVAEGLMTRWSNAGRNPFRVAPFLNPSGAAAFRVSGWLNGVRIRRNFPTEAEAHAERERLELQRADGSNRLRPVISRLSEEQVREAEAAFQLIGQKSQHSLLFFVEHGLAHHARAGYQKPLSEAVAHYLAFKTEERDCMIISSAQLRTIGRAMRKLCRHFPEQPVSRFTGETLLPFLERGAPSRKTYVNRRSLVFNFFKHALRHDWIALNPAERTPYYRTAHRRGSPKTLTASQAAELMAFVETFKGGTFVPYFALCLFAGIRPCFREGEMSRINTESILLDTRAIHVEPWVSKVKTKRTVTIQPNLVAWLRAYAFDQFPLRPKNIEAGRRDIFAKFDLSQEILRHTFISMFVGKFRSIGEAALQAGNSEAVVRRFYLDIKSPEEAEGFFGILPRLPRAEFSASCGSDDRFSP